MKIIAGLGNPGQQYQHTPHNVGFDVVERLAGRFEVKLALEKKKHGLAARLNYRNETILLLQPQTFMNRSGLAVSAFMRYYKVPPTDLVVVYDDADLEPGRLRVRPDGSSGGHRGMASIEEQLGTQAFARVRIGIGRGRVGGGLISHVLGGLSDENRALVGRAVDVAAEAAVCVVTDGVVCAMNGFNAWSALKEKEKQKAELDSKGESDEG